MSNIGNSIFEKKKMTSRSREERCSQAKQEGNLVNYSHLSRVTSSSSRSWSAFRNPRIVRVSRSFGGKDRHSKVFTVRGLRDRRIRLSVPAAVQLYDLQEKLGLNQPSKVIDWLLDVAKCDINKLPPLQIPQEYNQFNPSMASNKLWFSPLLQTNSTSMKHGLPSKGSGIDINEDIFESERERLSIAKSNLSNMDDLVRTRNKQIEREIVFEKGKWINSNVQESLGGIGSSQNAHVLPQNFLSMSNYNFSLSSLSNNRMLPYNQCESSTSSSSSSSSSSQFGSYGFVRPGEQYALLNTNSSPPSSSLALPSRAQFCFCPPPPISTPLIPSYSPVITTPLMENEVGLNHHQLFSSSSSQQCLPSFMPSFHLVGSPLLPSPANFRFVTPLSKSSCQTDEHDDSS